MDPPLSFWFTGMARLTSNRILVVGSGGREHAICWKLASSPKVETVFVAPGNADISKERKVSVADVDVNDFKAVATYCKQNLIGLVVVSPEDLLANGIADELTKEGLLCFGPTKAAAQIEANTYWAKTFMDRHKIPTPRWNAFLDYEQAKSFFDASPPLPALVVKASGLSAGKGIEVSAGNKEDTLKAVDIIFKKSNFRAGQDLVIVEELLVGKEASVLAFSDGTNVKLMLPAQDHKRLMAEDKGHNTGGIGAHCRYPFITDEELIRFKEQVLQKAVAGLKSEGIPFVGVLYAGLMLTNRGPQVLEFDCRFGDLETQHILPQLDTDLFDIIMACCTGKLSETELKWKNHLNAVGVVMANRGYPITSSEGQVMSDPTFTSQPSVGLQELLERVARVERTQDDMKRHVAAIQQRADFQQSLSNKRHLVEEKDQPRAAVLATRVDSYINTSFDSLAKILLIKTFGVYNGNFVIPFHSFFKAIGILCLGSSQLPAELKSSTSLLLRLCGKDVSLFLSALLEDFQEIGTFLTDAMKVTSSSKIAISEEFVKNLNMLGIKFELNQYVGAAPEMSTYAAVSMNCNRWPIFEQQNTIHGDVFSCEDGTSVTVGMMVSNTFTAQCGTWENATYLTVPLKNDGTLSMLLLLPNEGVKVQDMESKFEHLFMHSLMKRTGKKNVQLRLPKMTATTNLNGVDLICLLTDLFKSQGIKIPSLVGWSDGLKFSYVMKVVFAEGENGQGRPFKRSKPAVKPDLIFNCNRPFTFIVYNKTDYALLGGRVSHPQQDQPQLLPISETERAAVQRDVTQYPLPRQLLPNMNVAGSVLSGVAGAAEGAQVGGTIMNAQSTTINLQPGSTLHIHGNVQATPKRD